MKSRTIERYVSDLLSGDEALMGERMRELRKAPGNLEIVLRHVAVAPRPSSAVTNAFHNLWTEQGLWIRGALSADNVLLDALLNVLPGYGGPPLTLYRGDRWTNHENGTYGPSWTSKLDIAEMFARGVNLCPRSGGVVLKTVAPTAAVLATPNDHSRWLGEEEYVVDRRRLVSIEVLEQYFS